MEAPTDPTQESEQNLIQVLEWDRFIELAQREAKTDLAKDFLEDFESPQNWAASLGEAKQLQQETQEITPLLDRDALWGPLQDLPDPSEIFELLSKSSVLELGDLVVLRRWLYAVDSWIQVPRDEIRGEEFKRTLGALPDPHSCLRLLDRILTPEGEMNERATPKLAVLFQEIRSLKKEITIVLDSLLKSFSQKGILQENFTDLRDGRYVVPIKIASQNEVDGIIYEASASRQTVFVEPKEVAALNNRLRQRQNDLVQEIYSILEEVSKQLEPFGPELQGAVQELAYWDAVQAKARLGRHYSGKPIEITEERLFALNQTAHPLLWWTIPPAQIIRNDIRYGNGVRTLLLTGPNTGGKTVFLKTLGMAGICAKTGFPFPGIDHPTVPFFNAFFVDLGDSQSIEQHLSSFSGHVVRFKEILEKISDESLVLLDELNSATDPEEGAAFGRAVLETMMAKNAMIVTTTHDPRLKALATNDPRILNASMAFDETSKTPTYRMVLGVPGRSRALETAERLGIPLEVIQLARKYVSREHLEFEKLLSKIESDQLEAARARKEAVSLREEADRLKKEWTERTQATVQDMLDRTRQKLRRILEQTQDEVRATVRKLDESKSRRELDKTRAAVNDVFSQSNSQLESALFEEAPEIAKEMAAALPEKKESPSHPDESLQVGAKVRIPKWKSTGTIMEVSGSKIKVSMGTLQMTLLRDEVVPLTSPPKTTSHVHYSAEFTPDSQLDLRGVRFEEAMGELERYLDLVFRSGNSVEVTIVHGLGTGALREGTHRLLKKLPYVKSFRDGGPGHGGTGATVVEIERG